MSELRYDLTFNLKSIIKKILDEWFKPCESKDQLYCLMFTRDELDTLLATITAVKYRLNSQKKVGKNKKEEICQQ